MLMLLSRGQGKARNGLSPFFMPEHPFSVLERVQPLDSARGEPSIGVKNYPPYKPPCTHLATILTLPKFSTKIPPKYSPLQPLHMRV